MLKLGLELMLAFWTLVAIAAAGAVLLVKLLLGRHRQYDPPAPGAGPSSRPLDTVAVTALVVAVLVALAITSRLAWLVFIPAVLLVAFYFLTEAFVRRMHPPKEARSRTTEPTAAEDSYLAESAGFGRKLIGTTAALAALVAAAMFVLILSGEARPHAPMVEVRPQPVTPASPLVSSPAASIGSPKVPWLDLGPNDPLRVPTGPDRRVTLYSDLYAEGHEQKAQDVRAGTLTQAAHLVVLAANDILEADVRDWVPTVGWLNRNRQLVLHSGPEVAQESSEVGRLVRYRVDLDLSPENLKAVREHYLSSRSRDRTLHLLQAYAGTVLILGGLSIFLRLGTGRRPGME